MFFPNLWLSVGFFQKAFISLPTETLSKMRRLWLVLVVILLVVSIVISAFSLAQPSRNKVSPSNGVFFGVTFGSNSTSEAKLLVDKVKGYTNLFIVDSYPISTNETALNEVCDYAVGKGLNIIVYFSFVSHVIYPWQITWVDNAKERWGDKFLGIYIFDEPGGKQIDLGAWNNETSTFANFTTSLRDYDAAANIYNTSLGGSQSMKDLKAKGISAFTSDYALYWFDYQAGYDVVFAELGETKGQHNKLQAISQCRGAANLQGKDWGAILTWTYTSPPYLENGLAMLNDMLTAYFAGAKYIVVFNYPSYPASNPYGILLDDQFAAMKDFWTQIHSSQANACGSTNGQVALVLPKDYGSGLRSATDNIWGTWLSDNLSTQIWNQMNNLTKTYGVRLDIIYNDGNYTFEGKYPTIYYWNTP
jgi:hypothetical protein